MPSAILHQILYSLLCSLAHNNGYRAHLTQAPDVANALVFASTAPSVKSGEYYKAQNRPSDQSSIMNDVATAARLWELSEKVFLVKMNAIDFAVY